ncbi:MAG: cryptochrome/photolyase family protein [Bdellovibrionia bacterium]
MKSVCLILGNQLFHPELLKQELKEKKDVLIFMREDRELCTHFRYHQQKIVLFLAAMRHYARELREEGFQVHYERLNEEDSLSFEEALSQFIGKHRAKALFWFEVEDHFFRVRLHQLAKTLGIEPQVWQSPMFLTSQKRFEAYLKKSKKPFMKTFYEQQRKELNLLVDAERKPLGGKWSWDEDNRKSLPAEAIVPTLPQVEWSETEKQVIQEVGEAFHTHPGKAQEFWLPTTRKQAHAWLENFIQHRLKEFGPYEDALSKRSPFLFHSVLTPYLNLGLLTPTEVLRPALKAFEKGQIPLNSMEGFVRQIIGWREFIRGIDSHYGEFQHHSNFWNHHRRLNRSWYEGNTGVEPLDDVIRKVNRWGYAHHIERLMVVGCLMLLLEIHPHEAYRWFMEMFIDSSDWVMGPNVYGMALFSDGGVFATKPYICGSNYFKKMGGYRDGPWCAGVDGLYWSFIDRHRAFFSKNPRLSMMVRLLDRMPGEKKQKLFLAAGELKNRLSSAPQ